MWERVLQLESVQDLKMKPLPQILLRYFCSRTLRAILLAMPGWQNAITRTVPEPPLPCSLGSQRPQSESRLPVRSLAYAEEQQLQKRSSRASGGRGDDSDRASWTTADWLPPRSPPRHFIVKCSSPQTFWKDFTVKSVYIYLLGAIMNILVYFFITSLLLYSCITSFL